MTNKNQFLTECMVLDTETTSLDFHVAEVIELGYCLLFKTGEWQMMGGLYSPTEGPVTPEVSAVTHITQKMVEGRPSFEACAENDLSMIIRTLPGGGNLIAHNAFYDRSVLKKYNIDDSNSPWLCTMRMAKKLYADDDTVTQFNLPYLRYRFELEIPEGMSHHRATSDAYMTAKLLEHMVTEMEEEDILDTTKAYKPQIEEWLEAPVIINKMPFGKHKGKKLTEVPLSYWKWALGNLDSLNEEADEYDRDFAVSVALAVETML